MSTPRASKTADAAAAAQRQAVSGLDAADRIALALRLGRRARALSADHGAVPATEPDRGTDR